MLERRQERLDAVHVDAALHAALEKVAADDVSILGGEDEPDPDTL
jgi:hypothetical protein